MSEILLEESTLESLIGAFNGQEALAEAALSDPTTCVFADTLATYLLAETPDVAPARSLKASVLEAVAADSGDLGSRSDGVGGVSNIVEFSKGESPALRQSWWSSAIPWALAACLAVVAFVEMTQIAALGKSVAEVQGDLERSGSERDLLASTLLGEPVSRDCNVTVLKCQKGGGGRALAVWNGSAQEVSLHVANLPPLDSSISDYQLWIVDPQYEVPVDGGTFQVSEDGKVRHTFRAPLNVENAAAFAVTKEVAGGVEVSDGPHLLLGAVER